MEKLDELAKEIQAVQGGVNEVLRDTLGDYKEREAAREKRDVRRDVTIWMLIIGIVISFLYCQWSLRDASIKHQESIERMATENDIRFKEFLSQYDFETTTITADSTEGGTALANNGGDLTNGQSPNSNSTDDAQGR